MKQAYTGRQRVEAAFKAECADRIPFTTSIVDNKAFLEFLGLTPKEYYLDLDKALQASTKAQEMFPSRYDLGCRRPSDESSHTGLGRGQIRPGSSLTTTTQGKNCPGINDCTRSETAPQLC